MTLRNRLAERPVVVSYSSWKRWTECGMQERLLMEGAPRVMRERRDFLVGDVIHDMLEVTAIRRAKPETQAVVDTFEAKAGKGGVFYRNPKDKEQLIDRSVKGVNSLAPWLLQLLEQADDHKTEAEFAVPIPTGVPSGKPGDVYFRMLIKVDLILGWTDRTGNDHISIIDYKSGGKDPFQLHWYRAVYRLVDESGCEIDTFWAEPDPGGKSPKLTLVEPDLEEEARAVEAARTTALGIMNMDFKAKPDPYRCRKCRVRTSCPSSAYSTRTGRQVG